MSEKDYLTTPAGNPNATQEVFTYSNRQEFYSYGSLVVTKYVNGKVQLHKHWNASQTTAKYRNQFLGENLAETRRKIADGTYELDEGVNDE